MRSRTQAGLVTTTTAFCRSVAEHQVTLWGVKPNYGTNNNSSSSSSAHRNGRTAHHMKIDRAGWRLLQVHHQPSRDARQACRSQRTSHARAAHAHRSILTPITVWDPNIMQQDRQALFERSDIPGSAWETTGRCSFEAVVRQERAGGFPVCLPKQVLKAPWRFTGHQAGF